MACCPICFSSEFLRQYIIEHSTAMGKCESCGMEDASLIEASELASFFHNLLSMYEEAESYEAGERLISRVQWDWGVFNEDALGEDSQCDLLEEIGVLRFLSSQSEPSGCCGCSFICGWHKGSAQCQSKLQDSRGVTRRRWPIS